MFTPQQDPKTIFDRIFNSTGALLKGGLNKGADTAEGLYNSFHSAAEQTGVPQAIGGAVGAAGGAIGGAVGGLGNFFTQSLQGKGLDPKLMGQDIANTARSTANFGYQTGKEGAIAAPMSNAGKIVSGMMALPPARGVMNDVQSGNVNLGTGLKAGAAAASLYGAAKSPNWTPGGVFDPQLKALAGKIKDNVGIPGAGTMRRTDFTMLAQAIRDAKANYDLPDEEVQALIHKLNPRLSKTNPNFDQVRFQEFIDDGVQHTPDGRNMTNSLRAGGSMTKTDYDMLASVLKEAIDDGSVSPQTAGRLTNYLIPGIQGKNANFNPDKFLERSGLNQNTGIGDNSLMSKSSRFSPGKIQNGIDLESNYGSNLMQNDGGAVDSGSVFKGQTVPGGVFGNSDDAYTALQQEAKDVRYMTPSGKMIRLDQGLIAPLDNGGASPSVNKTLQNHLDNSYDRLMQPGNPEGEAIKMINNRYTPSHSNGDFVDIPLPLPSKYPKGEAIKMINNRYTPNDLVGALRITHPKLARQLLGGSVSSEDIANQLSPNDVTTEAQKWLWPKAQPGKWTDAYSRPMLNTGITTQDSLGIPKNSFLSTGTTPDEALKYGNHQGSAAVSIPNLTSAQQGAVSKVIKQSQALRNAMKAYQSGDMTDATSMSTKDTSKMDFTDPKMVDKFGYKTSEPNIPASDMKQVVKQAKGASPKRVMSNYDAVGLAEGWIEGSEKEVIKAWQHIVDNGLTSRLQGWFGRTAQDLIDQGVIKPKK